MTGGFSFAVRRNRRSAPEIGSGGRDDEVGCAAPIRMWAALGRECTMEMTSQTVSP